MSKYGRKNLSPKAYEVNYSEFLHMPWISTLQQLTQLFLTSLCPLCQRPASAVLCTACHRQLLHYRWTGAMQGNALGLACSKNTAPNVFPWGKYDGVLKQALALVKYDNQTSLGFWLGCQLGQHWKQHKFLSTCGGKAPVVIPIPLHHQRFKKRGYNQAAIMAQGFCRATGFSLAEYGLIRTKATVAMHGLSPQDRRQNLTNAFQLGKALPAKGTPILLLDDIYTTGSTIHSASMPLMQAGHTIFGITTVARAVFATQPDRQKAPGPLRQTPDWRPTL